MKLQFDANQPCSLRLRLQSRTFSTASLTATTLKN
jgi:hypothetical protein